MNEVIKRTITASILSTLFWIIFIYLPPLVFSGILAIILLHILLFEWPNLFQPKDRLFWIIMPFYPILPFALLIKLNLMPEYRNLLLILLIIISSFDTGGYIVGSLLGKHKIAPSISPGKSWEGLVGGLLAALIGLKFLVWTQHIDVSLWILTGFTLIVCTIGMCGDLFESWLKRRAQIKDSGRILPGHGGFLDRFDGILFGALFFYIFKNYLIQIFS